MADWRDVMSARVDAATALADASGHAMTLGEGDEDSIALAVAFGLRAVVFEIRALATLIDHARGDAS